MKTFSLRVTACAVAVATLLAGCTSTTDTPEPPVPGPETTDGSEAPDAPDVPAEPADDGDSDDVPAEPVDAAPLQPADGKALLLIDGWSLRAAGQQSLETTVGTVTRPVDWAPVSGPQLTALAGDFPEVVEAAISRMVDGASTVECDETGCLIGDAPVEGATAGGDVACVGEVCTDTWYRLAGDELAATARAAAIAGYGPMYESWSVGNLLYAAHVDITDATSLVLAHDTDTVLSLPLSAALDQDSEDDGARSTDPLQTGFGQDVHLVAFGIGRLFTPQATWRSTPDAPYIVDDYVTVAAQPEELADLGGLPLMGGVGSDRPGAKGLNASQLTYFTSPTTGCGVGLQCTPTGSVQGTVKVAAMEIVQVCGASDGVPTLAIVSDATVTMDLADRKIHQQGMWNSKQPTEFTGSTGGFFSGQAELVGDGTRMRVNVVHVLRGGGIVHDATGFAWQLGVDDPADAEAPFDAAATVDATGMWRTC